MSEPADQAELLFTLWSERHNSIDEVAARTGWPRSDILSLLIFNTLGHIYSGLADRGREMAPLIELQRKCLEDATKGDDWEKRT